MVTFVASIMTNKGEPTGHIMKNEMELGFYSAVWTLCNIGALMITHFVMPDSFE